MKIDIKQKIIEVLKSVASNLAQDDSFKTLIFKALVAAICGAASSTAAVELIKPKGGDFDKKIKVTVQPEDGSKSYTVKIRVKEGADNHIKRTRPIKAKVA